MNTLAKTITATVLSLSVLGTVHAAPNLVPSNNEAGTKLCLTATSGNVLKMSRAMKSNKLTKRYVTENVTCNGQNMLAFVEQYSEQPEKMNNYLTNGKYAEQRNIIATAR